LQTIRHRALAANGAVIANIGNIGAPDVRGKWRAQGCWGQAEHGIRTTNVARGHGGTKPRRTVKRVNFAAGRLA
jgi:hypothetical protein